MDDHTSNPVPPAPEEIEAANKAIDDFLAQRATVPENEKTILGSEKFAGPIGQFPPLGSEETQSGDDDSQK